MISNSIFFLVNDELANNPQQEFKDCLLLWQWSNLAMFSCSRMDENGDGHLTEEEFLRGCLQDEELSKMLAPNVVQ